jgi:outer membrane protein, heavy metal efflux system
VTRRAAIPLARLLAAVLALASPGIARAHDPGTPPLTYRTVLELATSRNLELAAVRKSKAVRQAEVQTARQWANPEFSAEVTRDTPHGDLALGFPLDISGRRSSRIAAAKAGLALADIDEAQALRQLRRDARLGFYGVLAADEELRLSEEAVGVARRFRDVVQAQVDEGAVPRLDLMQAELGVIRATADLDLARSACRAARADLNALLNQPPTAVLALAGDIGDAPVLPTLDRASASALANNVDLRALDGDAAVEIAGLGVLKAERVPAPVVSVGSALNAPGEFSVGAHAGVTLDVPLFSRNQGEMAGARARIDSLKARRDALCRQVESKAYAALERATAQRARAAAYRGSLLNTATELEHLAEESYRLGRSDVLAALDAQRSLRDVKHEYLQALLDLQAAIADLEDVLGASL